MTISIPIQRKWIFILTSKTISRDKPTSCRVVISRPQINRTRFSIEIFTAVTERISIVVIDVLLNAESIISILFSYFAVFICKIYNIAVSIFLYIIFTVNNVYKVFDFLFSCNKWTKIIFSCYNFLLFSIFFP